MTDGPVTELAARIDRLAWLSPSARRAALTVGLGPSEAIRHYLDTDLRLIEQEIVPLPAFRELGTRLWRPTDEQVTEVLGGPPPSTRGGWRDAAHRLSDDPARCLYCLANAFASACGPTEHPESRTVAVAVLAHQLRVMGRPARAGELLEQALGITTLDCGRADALRGAFRALESPGCSAGNVAEVAHTLAVCLEESGEAARAMTVLTAFLNIEVDDLADPNRINATWERLGNHAGPVHRINLAKCLSAVLHRTGTFPAAAYVLETSLVGATGRFDSAEGAAATLADATEVWLAHLRPSELALCFVDLTHAFRVAGRHLAAAHTNQALARWLADPGGPCKSLLGRFLKRLSRFLRSDFRNRRADVFRLQLLWRELNRVVMTKRWISNPQKEYLLWPPRWLGFSEERWDEHLYGRRVRVQLDALALTDYLTRLAGIERECDPLATAAFRQLCDAQSACQSAEESLRRFGVEGDLGELDYRVGVRWNWRQLFRASTVGSPERLFLAAQLAVDLGQFRDGDLEQLLTSVSLHHAASGSWDQAVMAGMRRFGLDDPLDEAALQTAKLIRDGEGAEDAAIDVCNLATALKRCGRREDARRLLLAAAGVTDHDLVSVELVADRFRGLEGRAGHWAVRQCVFALASAAMHCNYAAEAKTVLSAYLGVDLGKPLAADILARMVERIRYPDAEGNASLDAYSHASVVAATISWAERDLEATRVVEGVLGMSQDDFADDTRLTTRCAELRSIRAEAVTELVGDLGAQMVRRGQPRRAVQLMLTFLGLSPDHLGDGAIDERREVLAKFRQAVSTEMGAMFVLQLAGGLLRDDHDPSRDSATWFLQSYAGIESQGWHAHPVAAWPRLAAFIGRFSPDNAALYVLQLAITQESRGQFARAAEWLQPYFGVSAQQNDAELAGHLKEVRRRIQPNTYLLLLGHLVAYLYNLSLWGDESDPSIQLAARVLDADPDHFRMLDASPSHTVPPWNVHALVSVWLRCFGTRNRDQSLDFCRRAISYLRWHLAMPGVEADRPRALAAQYYDVRSFLIRTGMYWCSRPAGVGLWPEVLAWDAELGQRVLLERLQDRPAYEGTPDPTTIPRLGWEPPPRDGDGPRVFGTAARPGGGSRPAAAPRPPQDPEVRTALDALRFRLAAGATERDVAEALGRSLLLRAGFDLHGRLAWCLVGTDDGTHLSVLAQGAGPEDSRKVLREAAAAHGNAVRDAWAGYNPVAEAHRLRRECWRLAAGSSTLLAPVGPALKRFSASLREDPGWDDSIGYWQDLLKRLMQAGDYGARLAGYLRQAFPELENTAPAGRMAVLARWEWFTAPPDDRLLGEAHDRLTHSLDAATTAFLTEVGRVWDLGPARDCLDPARDLYAQLDDILHAVPVAFLAAGAAEGYLFERVRSVQTVLSPLLVDWLRRFDHPVTGPADRAMTLSWFRADDPARGGGGHLHRLQRELVTRPGVRCRWYATPDASHAGLAEALAAHGPFPLVTVCGHGSSPAEDGGDDYGFPGRVRSPGAVELADGHWTGAEVLSATGTVPGCDLASVEFLIQVSCSVGRVGQRGAADADGFCVELAASRCRSTLAGLWMLHSGHSPEFATWVAEEYLKLRNGLPPGTRPSDEAIRGKAVNAARARWRAASRAGSTAIGLNTAAAFHLFGLP